MLQKQIYLALWGQYDIHVTQRVVLALRRHWEAEVRGVHRGRPCQLRRGQLPGARQQAAAAPRAAGAGGRRAARCRLPPGAGASAEHDSRRKKSEVHSEQVAARSRQGKASEQLQIASTALTQH
jgi:hypothetical protein